MSSSTPPRNIVPSMGCGYVVCVLLAISGIALLFVAQSKLEQRKRTEAWIAGGFGTLLCVAGIGCMAPMQREVARAKERVRREMARPAEPWTWNPAWTAPGGIVQSGRRHGRALIVFAIAALALSAPAMLALPAETRGGNRLIWIALVFPLVALGILAVATVDAWRRRKYGVARFVPAAIPVPLGGEVAGMVIVNRPVVPQRPGRVAVDCWRTTVTRSGGKRRQNERVVAHTEREIAAGDWSITAGESQVFVLVPLRGGSASTMTSLDATHPRYEWRLRVDVPTPGADFVAEFVLPVFEIERAENGAGALAQPSADAGAEAMGESLRPDAIALPAGRHARPRSQVRRRSDRAEVWHAAKIREEPQTDARGNTALVLPAGIGRRLITAPLVMTVVFGGLTVGLWNSPVPGVIVVFVGFFGLLPALTLKSLWSGGGERVWIESHDICVQQGRRSLRRIAARDVQSVDSRKNIAVGVEQFHRVVARCRPRKEGLPPRRVEIASMVRGDEAAAEVIAWLEERLTEVTGC